MTTIAPFWLRALLAGAIGLTLIAAIETLRGNGNATFTVISIASVLGVSGVLLFYFHSRDTEVEDETHSLNVTGYSGARGQLWAIMAGALLAGISIGVLIAFLAAAA